MYRREGQKLPEPEEGAAYFDAFADVVPPRTMGLHPGMLTQGFVPIPGYGRLGDAAPAPEETTYGGVLSTPTPWLVGAAGLLAGFLFGRRKR